MHNSRVVRKVLYWLLLCLYYQVYIILCSYNISLTYNTTNQRLSFIQHFIQRLSFSLLIILYCLFIVPECSTALFTLHVHVVGSCPLLLVAGRLLVVCLLVATGNIELFPSYYSAPSHEPLSSSSCVWRVLLLHPLLADS